jgi:hypothetical protein
MPDAQPHPRALRAKEIALRAREAITGQPKQPAFPARRFMAYSALSPVSGLLATVACELVARKLDLSNGRPGPRGFAIRMSQRRSSHASPRVHRSPLPTSVTVATPLFSGGGTGGDMARFLENVNRIIFAQGTGQGKSG